MRIDAASVVEFLPGYHPDAPRAEVQALFFLAGWREHPAARETLAPTLICIDAPPPSVCWLAEQTGARLVQREGSQVLVSVTDTGVGIATDFLPHVFDRFRQADSTSTRQHTGMGLGLAIVRHVVELHGGTVRADSAGENAGSTFTVSLPLLAAERALGPGDVHDAGRVSASGGATARPSNPWRVLLVDDDEDGREVTVAGLQRAGFELRAVSTAAQALALLDHWLPDVIVSDIGMPGMNGYEFMRALRARPPERGGRVAALALTGFARLEDAVQARESGFQGHLAKPISSEDLAAAVARLQKSTAAEQP